MYANFFANHLSDLFSNALYRCKSFYKTKQKGGNYSGIRLFYVEVIANGDSRKRNRKIY